MATRLFLVRHGATTFGAEDRFAGSTEVDLSDEGRRQSERLATRLADERIVATYCSPMRRTVETASILARPHRLELLEREGLREIAHGRWEGLTRREVEAEYPEEYAAWEADPFTFAPVGGESGISVMARALPVIRDVVTQHANHGVLIVSHKATIRLLISSLLGFDARGYRDRLDQSPACLNILDFKDPVHARLMLFNDVSHYTDHAPSPQHHLSKTWDTDDGDESQ